MRTNMRTQTPKTARTAAPLRRRSAGRAARCSERSQPQLSGTMRILGFGRYAVSICVASAVFAGCGALPLSLSKGQDDMQPPIGARAAMSIEGPCIYLLSTTEGASNLSNAQIHARRCYIYINDTANMSYSTITAAKILYGGSPPNEMGATFPEATPAPGPTVKDPCPKIPGCSYLLKHPPATSGCSPGNFNGNGLTIGGPGEVTCFSTLTISGENETVCGLIEITGSQLHLQGSSITSCSSGVTFAMSSNTSDTNFSDSTLTLSAPQTGHQKDVLLYRVKSQSNSVNFSTCSCDFTGILYFPTTPVDYAETACNRQLLIFGQANLSNSEPLCFGRPYAQRLFSEIVRS
jgi:hypothetical protein